MQRVQGNILDAKVGILVHGVNMQGKFNAGLAKQIRQMYPKAYQDYMRHYEHSALRLGDVIFTPVRPGLMIASAVTQEFYGRDPNYVYVNYHAVLECFKQVGPVAIMTSLPVIHPRIGVGLANGDWSKIEDCIHRGLAGFCDSTVYDYTEP